MRRPQRIERVFITLRRVLLYRGNMKQIVISVSVLWAAPNGMSGGALSQQCSFMQIILNND